MMRPILIDFELFDRYIAVESYIVFNLILNPLIFVVLGALFLNSLTKNKLRSWLSAITIAVLVIIGSRFVWSLGVIGRGDGSSANPFQLFPGGFTMVGGFVFAAPFFPLVAKFNRINTWQFLDMLTPGWALGIMFNKIGCFLNGCCIGVKTESFFGMQFPMVDYPDPVFPTQLYESISGLIGFLIVLVILKRQKAKGLSFSFFAFYFAVVRFLLDFIKEVPPKMTLPSLLLPVSYSLLIILTGYIFLRKLSEHRRLSLSEREV